jgi:hypothetical protein
VKIRAAAARVAKGAKVAPVGKPGATAGFDPKAHKSIDGPVRAGQRVDIVRPGYTFTLNGETIQLSKALVEPAVPIVPGRPAANAPSLATILDGFKPGRVPTEAIGRWVDGTYAGLEATVTKVQQNLFGGLSYNGVIKNAEGAKVGQFARRVSRDTNGDLYVTHELLKIGRGHQGSGFQAAFNGNLIDWYKRSGVAYVKVGANIDVGGYTWARAGYDFATDDDAVGLFGRLEVTLRGIAGEPLRQLRWLDDAHRVPAYAWDGPVVDQHRVVPWSAVKLRKAFKGADDAEIERQLRIGREFVDRLAGRTFGDDLPSAYELSQLGRWQGAGKDDVWIGKLVMLGSAWLGILRL